MDAYEKEPLPGESPLLGYANVLATPQIGDVERDSFERYFRTAFENVLRFAEGTPANLLNPEALVLRAAM